MEAREFVYVLGARRGLPVLRRGGAADCALCCQRGQRDGCAWHERGGGDGKECRKWHVGVDYGVAALVMSVRMGHGTSEVETTG